MGGVLLYHATTSEFWEISFGSKQVTFDACILSYSGEYPFYSNSLQSELWGVTFNCTQDVSFISVSRLNHRSLVSIEACTMFSTLLKYYNDVIMDAMASQITGLAIVCSTVHSGADERRRPEAPRHWPLCREFTGEFLAQMASNAENASIWWRHHEQKSRVAVMPTLLLLVVPEVVMKTFGIIIDDTVAIVTTPGLQCLNISWISYKGRFRGGAPYLKHIVVFEIYIL